jgi:hypothetical protein
VLSPRTSSTRRALAGGLAASLLAAGVAVGSAGADDARVPAVASPGAAQPAAIGAVQADQAQTLRVLRRARRASDAVPAVVANEIAGPARFGRNAGLARAIDTPTGTGWVVPGDDTVCLVAQDPVDGWATTCAPTSVVRTDGLTLGLADADGSTVVTLVPDGAEVSVTDDDDRTAPVSPDSSGIVAVDATDADHVAVVTDEGTAETPLLSAEELAAGTE